MSFVHLHNHTEYSLLDGAVRVKALIETARQHEMPAVAITDHGYMYGAVDAVTAGLSCGIKVIPGCEVYVAPRSLHDKDSKQGDGEPSHLVLLASTNTGYRNLMRLVSVACVDGFYYRPRVDRDLLRQHSEGIIAMSACVAGEIPKLLLAGDYGGAKHLSAEYADIFAGRFFLEVQRHGLAEEDAANPLIQRISAETGIGMVASNDVHYVHQADARFHDVMLCIQTGKRVSESNRMRFSNDQFYFKSVPEMQALFADMPDAVENTLRVADMCNVKLEFGQYHLPSFPLPQGQSPDAYLSTLCAEGASRRFGSPSQEVADRLALEIGVISRMGFSSYFLVVWDFIRWAKEHDIAVGPGRGSSAGSLVAYTLGITDVDPLAYGLLFERFLNPERISMPDIDVDFDDRRRGEVIDYVTRQYGSDRVAQITTFGTLKARSAIRDVARAMDMSLSKADKLARLIPFGPGTLSHLLEGASGDAGIQELRRLSASDTEVRDVLDCAQFVEGFPRHASVHAAGVVITQDPITSLVPLARTRDGGSNVTQYPMGTLEKLGLLKIDFLGLSNLNIIRDAVALVERTTGKTLDIDSIPLDDKKTMQLFATGQTMGVFQFESSGMRQMLQEFRPQRFEDLILLNAAYRPGPMQMIPAICDARHGRQQPVYLHPLLEPILSATYGSIVYQEQVMQIVQTLGGFSLGRADLLRRAMSKKQKEVMDRERDSFVAGCAERSIDEATANRVYELVVRFAEYGFPKAHSTAYSLVAFRTAYLKAHYPSEFMAARITADKGNYGKVGLYISECRRLGIKICAPDINKSGVEFEPLDRAVIFGLSAIRNIGQGTAQAIVNARASGEFTSLSDLCVRAGLSKREAESLIRSGACLALGNRAQLLAVLEGVMKRSGPDRKSRTKDDSQLSLLARQMFPDAPSSVRGEDLPDMDELPGKDCMALEKEYLGLYVSGHPLDGFTEALEARGVVASQELGAVPTGSKVIVAGVITGVKRTVTKKGAPMAFVTLEDHAGTIEVIVFPVTYKAFSELLREDVVAVFAGKNDTLVAEGDDDGVEASFEPKVIADSVDLPDAVTGGKVTISLDRTHGPEVLTSLAALLKDSDGRTPVYLKLVDGSSILTSQDMWVTLTPELRSCVEALVGKQNCGWQRVE